MTNSLNLPFFLPLSPLANPSATRAVLEEHGLAAKHALGQNFLINDAIVQKIAELAQLCCDDIVLEVGPGIGTLTLALLKLARGVVAVERDKDLPCVLAQTCAAYQNKLALINKDALKLEEVDVKNALRTKVDIEQAPGLLPTNASIPAKKPLPNSEPLSNKSPLSSRELFPNKFVANLPYAVAATLVLDYFERFSWLDCATVMVQKEVADRMMAQPGSKNYGAYTVKLSLFACAEGSFDVAPSNFYPAPRINSTVIRLMRNQACDDAENPISEDVRRAAALMANAAFTNRRKTIANSCKAYFTSKGQAGTHQLAALAGLFDQANIDPQVRGETLCTSDFIRLGQAFVAQGLMI